MMDMNLVIMIMIIFMLMLNLVMIMMWIKNLMLILITHNLRIKDMIRENSLLGNIIKRENHGFGNPCPFLLNHPRKKDDEDFERFVEMLRPVFLQMRLTDMLKMSPYAKYMKDIVTNKRKIPEVEISTMLANVTTKMRSFPV